MNAWLRIAVMFFVTEICLSIIGGGFDLQKMAFAGGFIIVILSLPLIGVLIALNAIEQWTGRPGAIVISTIGLIPSGFVFIAAPAMGVRADFEGYTLSICVAGWIWSAAWLLTSKKILATAADLQTQ